jgi:hypothetical protein
MSALDRSRDRLVNILNSAFAEGLLSEQTHSHRVGLVLGPQLIDTRQVVGDLPLRKAGSSPLSAVRRALAWLALSLRAAGPLAGLRAPLLLVLDDARSSRLVVGRDDRCDVVVADRSVSRRHAQLTFRDGTWVLQDLSSTNGTRLNGKPVGRAAVRPGDLIALGGFAIQLD